MAEQQICQAAIEGDIDCINDESRQGAPRPILFEIESRTRHNRPSKKSR